MKAIALSISSMQTQIHNSEEMIYMKVVEYCIHCIVGYRYLFQR